MLQRRPAAARSLARLQPDQGGLHQAPSPGLPRREPGAAPPAAPQHGIARREQCGDPARRAPARMEHRRVRVQALQQPRRVPAAAVLAAGHQQLRAAAPRLSSRPAPPADPACGRACPAAAATSRTHANMRHRSTRALPAARAGTRGSPAAASRQRPRPPRAGPRAGRARRRAAWAARARRRTRARRRRWPRWCPGTRSRPRGGTRAARRRGPRRRPRRLRARAPRSFCRPSAAPLGSLRCAHD